MVYEYDDDVIVSERELTDEEYAAAVSAYEKTYTEWQRTAGTHRERTGTRYELEVTCADGCTARAVSGGEGWTWVEWTVRAQASERTETESGSPLDL